MAILTIALVLSDTTLINVSAKGNQTARPSSAQTTSVQKTASTQNVEIEIPELKVGEKVTVPLKKLKELPINKVTITTNSIDDDTTWGMIHLQDWEIKLIFISQ